MNNTLSPLGMDCRTWNGVEIQRRPSDGYVNATAMCQAGGREWFTYARSERTRAYISALAAIPQNCGTELVQSIQGGPPHRQGTWIHPRLAVDLARWISPEFAVWMDGWFLDVMRRKLAGGAAPAPSPVAALPAGISWHGLAELYAAERENELRNLPEIDRPRSARFSRPVAEHFIQWLLFRVGQVALPTATGEPVTVGFSAPAQPPLRQAALMAEPVARQQGSDEPERNVRRRYGGFAPGYRIAAPELARLLGISSSALNYWARRMHPGAVRYQPDGTAWQLVGKGKIRCGFLGSTIPPGGPSWLFERVVGGRVFHR